MANWAAYQNFIVGIVNDSPNDADDVSGALNEIVTYLLAGVDAIAPNTVETEDYQDGSVTGSKIAANTILSGNIANDVILSRHISTGAIDNVDYLGNALITPVKMAPLGYARRIVYWLGVSAGGLDDFTFDAGFKVYHAKVWLINKGTGTDQVMHRWEAARQDSIVDPADRYTLEIDSTTTRRTNGSSSTAAKNKVTFSATTGVTVGGNLNFDDAEYMAILEGLPVNDAADWDVSA